MPNEDTPEAMDAAAEARENLPQRWRGPAATEENGWVEGVRYHPEQAAARLSTARHRAIEAGRRSGKSEDRKREIVIAALDPDWPGYAMGLDERRIVVGCPVQHQTNRIYLKDLRRMIPRDCMAQKLIKSPLPEFRLITGAVIYLVGMDAPERAEGDPIDDLFFDEFAEMKPSAWEDHLSYSLETPGRPPGRVTFFSTPDLDKGLHFVDLADQAKKWQSQGDPDWSYHHWSSKGIVSDKQWEKKKATTDPARFAVEMEARRVSTGLLAYHCWTDEHAVPSLKWFPGREVSVCVDFNRDPGTAVIVQEQAVEDYSTDDALPENIADRFTAVLGEVFLRDVLVTDVMRDVLELLRQKKHKAQVKVYGDASGGAGTAVAVEGSAIDLIPKVLAPTLGDRLDMRFQPGNPEVLSRVLAMNARMMAADGFARMVVDRSQCPQLIRDFQVVKKKERLRFDIEKPTSGPGKLRTHLSDGLGYYIHGEFPVEDNASGVVDVA